MAAVFKRGKFYWIRYTLDGKQHRESLCTRSEKVAKIKLRQYEVALDSGTFQFPSKTFLETLLAEHCNHLKGIRPKKSWVNEENRLLGRRSCSNLSRVAEIGRFLTGIVRELSRIMTL